MKLKYLILIFLLTPLTVLYSKEISIYHYSFIEGSETYLFGDNVRVRKEPEIKNDNIIDTLAVGDKLTIVQKTEKNMKIDGYKENWYKIRYKKNSRSLEGYVWGGFLSIGYSVKGERLFLTGLKKFSADKGFIAECRLVEKSKVLSSVTFEPHYLSDGNNESVYEYIVTTEIKSGMGLEGIDNICRIFFNFEACGYPRGNVWIGCSKDKLYYIGKDTSISEAGVFHVEEKYIFPAVNKTDKGTVLLVNEAYDFDEKLNDYKLREKIVTGFKWKEGRLNPHSK